MRWESALYICVNTSVVALRNLPTFGSIQKIGTEKDSGLGVQQRMLRVLMQDSMTSKEKLSGEIHLKIGNYLIN